MCFTAISGCLSIDFEEPSLSDNLLNPYFEYQDLSVSDSDSVGVVQGRLREHSQFWLNASDFVKGIVQEGYRLPFLALLTHSCDLIIDLHLVRVLLLHQLSMTYLLGVALLNLRNALLCVANCL